MEKKKYETPQVTIYGDVKEITQGGGRDLTQPDGTYITLPDGSVWAGFNS